MGSGSSRYAGLPRRFVAAGWVVWLGFLPVAAAGQAADPLPAAHAVPFGPIEAILLRSTIAAIAQADTTGNYAVLQALMAPEAGKALTPAALAALFKPWRDRQRDIGFAVIADAEFKDSPRIEVDGSLRLAGTIPTPSFVLAFDLSFRKVGGRWMLAHFMLGDGQTTVDSTPAIPATSSAAAPPATPVQTIPARLPPLPPDRPAF